MAGLLVGPKAKALAVEPAAVEPETESPARLAAQGILDAVAAGDVSALEDALATFLDARAPGSL